MKKITTTFLICLATFAATAQTAKIYDFAGNHNLGNGYSGDGGLAVGAKAWEPWGMTFDASGNLYFCDSQNGVVRRVNTAGVITTVAGNQTLAGNTTVYTGPATSVGLGTNLTALCFDGVGNLFIADGSNELVWEVSAGGNISVFAGGGSLGVNGVAPNNATLGYITGLAYTYNSALFGPNGALLIAQTGSTADNLILSADVYNNVLQVYGGGATAANYGDGGAIGSAAFNNPRGMAFDAAGNLYIADAGNNRVRIVNTSGVINNFAGSGTGASGFSGDGSQALAAKLSNPVAVSVDASGNVYIVDNGNGRIRKVNSVGTISTVAGTSISGYNGDAIAATTAQLQQPSGVACDASGNIYIADLNNNEVREVTTNCVPQTIISQPKDTTVCPGTEAQITCNYVNYTGYQWQLNSGSGFVNHTVNYYYSGGSTDTIQNPSIPMNGWQYRCIVKGCGSNITSSTATLTITYPVITCNTAIICAGSGASATLTASGASSGTYNWSTGDVTDYIVENPTVTTTYTVTGTDNTTGCNGTGTGTITVLQPQVPTICEVTTDSVTNYKYNYIYWNSSLYSKVDSFIIYRYDAGSGHYLRIGSRANDSLSVYIDKDSTIGGPHGGNPAYASWKYALAIRDSCGNIGAKGPYHQSIFVQQTGQNFSWTAYVDSGFASLPTGYAFLRDSLGIGDYHLLAYVSTTSSTDPNYTTYPNAVYRVDALGFNCTPTTARLPHNNSVDAAKVKSHSNTNNNRGMTTGINKVSNTNQVGVYPNPNNGSFVIDPSNTTKQTIQLLDMNGKMVLSQIINGKTTIDASSLSEGVYTISLISSEGVINKRLVIVR